LSFADDNGLVVGSFTTLTFSGYITSGSIVLNEVCIYNQTICKIVRVYVVTQILADQWFYGVAGGSGILGVGPNSAFVRQFTDVATNTQTYSIVVGRASTAPTNAILGAVANTTQSTNITFGPSNDPYYAAQSNYLTLTADQTTGTYKLSTS
jgi:hypothetical protein